MKLRIIWAALLALLTISAASAETVSLGNLEIRDAWARASAPGAPSAGFLLITNSGTEDDTLLAVRGDFAKRLEVHQSKMEDGVMKMAHQKDGVVIPAGESVLFKPGSYHLMFMGLAKNFEHGEQYRVVLSFAQAGDIAVILPVQDAPGDMAH